MMKKESDFIEKCPFLLTVWAQRTHFCPCLALFHLSL